MNKVQSRVGSSTFHEIRRRQGSSMQRESEPDTLSVPSDSERIAVIHDASVYRQRTGARQRPKAYSGFTCLQTSDSFDANTCRLRKPGKVSRSYSRQCRIATRDMYSSRGTSSFPMEGNATSKPRTGSLRTFPDTTPRLSRNRFEIAFGRSPVREIAVSFEATDSDYTEVKRVLQIMIPPLVIS